MSEETVYYKVIFQDYDETILDEQTVQKGGDAVAPSNPSRTGYNFIGWNPSYENVQSNLTIIAQYIVNKNEELYDDLDSVIIPYEKFGFDTTNHQYGDFNTHTMRMSSNVIMLNIQTGE